MDRLISEETVSHNGRQFKVSLNYYPNRTRRGFYVSVTLLGLKGETILTNMHSKLIFGCKRYSKTAEDQAKTFYDDGKEELIEQALTKEIK